MTKIICPACSKQMAAGLAAEASMRCPRCKSDFYVYLRDGVLVYLRLENGVKMCSDCFRVLGGRISQAAGETFAEAV